MLMEGDPFCLIEGMAIAGFAVGASKGYVYTRSEYPHAIATFDAALGDRPRGGTCWAREFDIEQRVGAGAYVCGEETSLLESLEGRRGQVRAKPPLPAHKGLFGQPTVINNVITLASVPVILRDGAEAYQALGFGRSRGTMPIQLAGNVRYGGLFEAGFGLTLGEIVNDIGGGTLSGRPVRAVQVGGPLGAYFPPSLFDTPFDYEAFAAKDGLIGHGGVVVFDDTVDMAHQARFAMEFCSAESCGKCTPCRIGSVRGMETMDKILRGHRGRSQSGTDPRSLSHHEVRFALRSGRVHSVPGDECTGTFSGRFPPRAVWRRRLERSSLDVPDPGTRPRNEIRCIGNDGDADRRWPHGHRAGGHLDHARLDGGRDQGAQTLRHRLAGQFRQLPHVPRRDRGPRRHAGILHHAGRSGHESADLHRETAASCGAA